MKSLLYAILLFLAASCSYPRSCGNADLDSARRLLPTDPQAALARLNGCDVSEFGDSDLMARWALLYSEALVANNLSAPTDTIVDIAIDYYGRRDMTAEFTHATRLKALLADTTGRDELATALYLQKEKEFMLYRERSLRERYICIGAALLILAGAIIAWQRQRLRINRLRSDALMAEASTLRREITRHISDCSALAAQLSDTVADRFSTIDSLCSTYYESQGTKTERKAIAEKVKQLIESLKSDSGLFAEMEAGVDECRGRLLTLLKQEWPGIKPDDYRLAVYLSSGLSNRTIALLTGESMAVVYKRKSRLKARLTSMQLPHTDLFLSMFRQ